MSLGSQMLRGAGDGGTSPFPRRSDPWIGSILDGWTDGWTDGRGTEAFGVCGLVVAAHQGRERLILALHRDRTGQKEREKKAITRAVRAHDGRSAWLMCWLGAVAAHR